MTVKPRGKFIYHYPEEFEVGDKVEILEGSDLAFFGVRVGDTFPLVEGYSGPTVLIGHSTYNGDKLVLRKVGTKKRKGLCDFLTRVEAEYSGRPRETQYAHKK